MSNLLVFVSVTSWFLAESQRVLGTKKGASGQGWQNKGTATTVQIDDFPSCLLSFSYLLSWVVNGTKVKLNVASRPNNVNERHQQQDW